MAYSNDNSYDLMGIFEFIIYIIHETNLCDNYCDSPPAHFLQECWFLTNFVLLNWDIILNVQLNGIW